MRRSKLTAAEAAAFAAATAEELKRTSEESGSMAGSMALSPRTGVMVTRDPLMSLIVFIGIADRAKLYGCSRRVRFFSVFGS